MNERNNSSGSTAGYAALFIAGLAIGTLATGGLLMYMAPSSSKKMRREITRKGIDFRDQAYDRVDDIKDNANELLSRGRAQSKRLAKQAKGMRNDAMDTMSVWQKRGQRQARQQGKTPRGFVGGGRRLVNRVFG